MAESERSWGLKWERGGRLGGGGQAITYLARPANSPPECPFDHVLKLLKDQKDPDRRARMYREVAALRTLQHDRIARYVDSNADLFKDDAELYLVTALIPGVDLDQFRRERDCDWDHALRITLSIVETLAFCHSKQIIHRDIKPSNIIIRSDDAPVLLDFGLSFNEKADALGIQTEDGQHLGNRFLALPELLGTGDKRDAKSDLTQTVGILFFLGTGSYPVQLFDRNDQLPHQRQEGKSQLAKLPPGRKRAVERIFAVGFQQRPDARWQTAAALRDALLLAASPDGIPEDGKAWRSDLLEAREAILTSGDMAVRCKARECLGQIQAAWNRIFETFHTEMRDIISVGRESVSLDAKAMLFESRGQVQGVVVDHRMKIWIRARLDNTEIAIRARINEDPDREILRLGVSDPEFDKIAEAGLGKWLTENVRIHFTSQS